MPERTVALPPEMADLQAQLQSIARQVQIWTPVVFIPTPISMGIFDAILSVGTTASDGLPATIVNSNGWIARVSSGSTSLSDVCDQANPVGALGAACLGVTEVFKRLVALRPEKGELLDGVTFSFWSYRTDDADPGPQVPAGRPSRSWSNVVNSRGASTSRRDASCGTWPKSKPGSRNGGERRTRPFGSGLLLQT
jgi:hypothetical protein